MSVFSDAFRSVDLPYKKLYRIFICLRINTEAKQSREPNQWGLKIECLQSFQALKSRVFRSLFESGAFTVCFCYRNAEVWTRI